MTVLDKTFHIMGDACENSDFFVIKKRASRSRVITKICLSRRKRRGHCFEIAPLKVGILLQIHLGKVLQLQISTFFLDDMTCKRHTIDILNRTITVE